MSTFYVSTLGSDLTGDGTISNPFLSITKAVNVINNSDTISLLPGTYNIYSIINITKSITITGPNATINGSDTVFNIQANNVTITNITIESSSITNPVISIDRNSDGTTVPTLYTGNNITYCTLRYTSKCLYLNGTYNITNNTLRRCTGSISATVITIYTLRGTCNISNNTLIDSENILYVIYLSNSGSGTYLDLCNSKTGTLNIQNNNITVTDFDVRSAIDPIKFIYQDYFNTYLNASTESYNYNTKLTILNDSNTITTNLSSKLTDLLVNSATSCNMFDHIIISNNTNNNTFQGALHIDKLSNSTTYTVDSIDQNRSIFNIINNTLTSIVEYRLMYLNIQDPNTATLYSGAPVPNNTTNNYYINSVGIVNNLKLTGANGANNDSGLTYRNYPINTLFKTLYASDSRNCSILLNITESPIFTFVLVHKGLKSSDVNAAFVGIDNNVKGYASVNAAESDDPSYCIVDNTSTNTLRFHSGDLTNTMFTEVSTIPLNTVRIDFLIYGASQVTRYVYNKTNLHISTFSRSVPYKIPKKYVKLGGVAQGATIEIFEFQLYNKDLSQTEADNIAAGLRTKYNAIM